MSLKGTRRAFVARPINSANPPLDPGTSLHTLFRKTAELVVGNDKEVEEAIKCWGNYGQLK